MNKKNVFNLPYIGIDSFEDFDLLYGLNGEFSVILQILNPVLQFGGSSASYDEFHSLFLNIIKILGDGYTLQKQDIIFKIPYPYTPSPEYLQDSYNAHFAGRQALRISTYLTITRSVKKGSFYVFDKKNIHDFRQAIGKVVDILSSVATAPVILREKEINKLIVRVLSMNFANDTLSLDNIAPTDTQINMGNKAIRSISLVNIDSIDLPSYISTHTELNDKDTLKGFPIDLFSFLLNVPQNDSILFNQVIQIPNQQATLNKLELKRKRHSGIPDPANLICVEDIDLLLNDVARDNQLLVNAHYNIMISAGSADLQKAANYIESSLFQLGIIPSKNSYNQLELYRTALPGNAVELKHYDLFQTTCDAAICLFFKECLPVDEPSDFLIRFTDRQGIPVGIDLSDLPMRMNRISARNRFILGPSGSGKSYLVNVIIEQYMQYNMDVVIVDVGHSYSGLCTYFKGKYITWSDSKPITMNPFAIKEEEYNIEKKDFLVTLISLLWKGAEGMVNAVERDVISNVISRFFTVYFLQSTKVTDAPEIKVLNFNSFYEFALLQIPAIKEQEHIFFDLDEFRYVLKKFYLGGEFQSILNEATDESLFSQRLIVYEIDAVKENKILFPIITLTIMDLFLQKMRHRKDQRKALIIEEAWKAIASPLMAGYILYLYKTVRKFWGEAIVVTQELGDILGNAVVKDSILNNSDTVFLLDQSKFKENYKEVAKLLSISESEQKKIFTINQLDNKEGRSPFKEVYIRRGAVGEVYGVEVSLAQYLTYTTEKPEKSAVEIYVSELGSYPAGLTAFIKDMQQSKLSLGEFVTRTNRSGSVSADHFPSTISNLLNRDVL